MSQVSGVARYCELTRIGEICILNPEGTVLDVMTGKQRLPRVGDKLRVVKSDLDLGIDVSTTCLVVWTDGETMDVDCPSLDMRYAQLSVDAPAFQIVGFEKGTRAKLQRQHEAQVRQEVDEVLGRRGRRR